MSLTAEEQMLIDILKRWQKAENAAISVAARVLENSPHPLLRLVMEIIQRDSLLHHRVQQMVIDDVERKTMWQPSKEEFDKVWDDLTDAIGIEHKFIGLAENSLESLKGQGKSMQECLIRFLLEDEKKHSFLLEQLKLVKETTE